MFNQILQFLTKVGLVAEGTITGRELTGWARIVTAIIAVGFSFFFIYTSFFGPPIAEVFRGSYMLGTAVMCILFFKGREAPLREDFIWLSEIFYFLAMSSMVGFLCMGIYWLVTGRVELWQDFEGVGPLAAGAVGFVLGALLYWKEGTAKEISGGFVLSDWLFVLSTLVPLIWWYENNAYLQARLGASVLAALVVCAGLLVCVSFEIARRVVGPIIPLIGFFFLLYTFKPIAHISPGLLYHDGFKVSRVAEFLLLSADGITGLIIEVFANFVVIFVVLGAFLEKTGLGSLFIDVTFRFTGQRTGGPGLTAVVSSGLFGMISGSGVANVVTTGTFTIPLMKRVGYKPEFAAAVEAAASTGGAYMPPIMGAGAFLLAQFTEISYFEVIKIAAIPAVLYYLSVGYIVYIRALWRGLHGVPASELPSWDHILPRLHMLLPIPVMVYFLLIGDSAFLAAFKTICIIVLLKTADLLNEIPTPWSSRTGKTFFLFSVLFGLFTYYLGLSVGAPFTWFADIHRGINLGDALFWTVAGYIFLKLVEIVSSAFVPSEGEAEPASGTGQFRRLGASFIELVKVTWLSMEAGAKNSLIIGSISLVLGVLLSCATQSDLPGRVSSLLIEFSFGLLPLTIFWVIVAGYIVGMGLPITASYVVLVIFGVVSLTNLGVPTLAAHLICYWVAVVSAVTPPVALAAYAASAIANADPVKTGFQAVKLASWIFIMPFLFVYTPLLLNGSLVDILVTIAACVLGIAAWAGTMEGFLIKKTRGVERLLLAVSATCLLLPVDHLVVYFSPLEGERHLTVYAIGLVLLAITFFMQRSRAGAASPTIRAVT